MSQVAIIYTTIAVYVVMIAVIGVITGRRSRGISDFTVGGRNAGAWLSALSYGTAYFSAVMFVGYAGGTGKSFGLWGILAGLGNAVFGSWLAWKVLARRTRDVSARLKLKTMPEYFEQRYGSTALKYFAAAVIFVFMVPYSASVYKGLASIADVLLGIDVNVCMIIIAVMAMLILVLGGYLVQARADFVQGVIMFAGIVLLLVFVVKSDKPLFDGGMSGIIEYARTAEGLPKLNASQWITLWATVLMTSFGTWGLPQMVTKYFGIKDDRQAKRGVTISTVFALLVAGGGYFIGALCYMYFNKADVHAGTPAQDYLVPMMLKLTSLPTVLLGIVIVLLLSASVSTLCSVSLTASSVLSVDLINDRAKKPLGQKKLTALTKILCAVFVVISFVVANTKTPILDMMSYSWGVISGSFLAPYVLALYDKKITKKGAWAGVLTGFFIAMIPAVSKIITMFAAPELAVKLAGMGPTFACIAMIASIIVTEVVGRLTYKSSDELYIAPFYSEVKEEE